MESTTEMYVCVWNLFKGTTMTECMHAWKWNREKFWTKKTRSISNQNLPYSRWIHIYIKWCKFRSPCGKHFLFYAAKLMLFYCKRVPPCALSLSPHFYSELISLSFLSISIWNKAVQRLFVSFKYSWKQYGALSVEQKREWKKLNVFLNQHAIVSWSSLYSVAEEEKSTRMNTETGGREREWSELCVHFWEFNGEHPKCSRVLHKPKSNLVLS